MRNYIADEVNTGGIAIESRGTDLPAVAGTVAGNLPAVAGTRTPNCSTPGLSIRVRLDGGNMDVYEAVFVAGPLKGAKPVITRVSTFTQEKWDKCMATSHRWQCPGRRLADAQPHDVSRAVSH